MDRASAEENLRIIRALLERATLYRALAAPTALVAGLLAMATSIGSVLWVRAAGWDPGTGDFVGPWVLVLAATAAANALFLWRGARGRGEPFWSGGLKVAGRAIMPVAMAGGFVTAWFYFERADVVVVAVFWLMFYGLGLLSTAEFAPGSLVRLGWWFLAAGLVVGTWQFMPTFLGSFTVGGERERFEAASALMAGTFGLFHLVYAGFTWPGAGRGSDGGGDARL